MEDSYTQGWLPSSLGKLGRGEKQKGWEPEEARYGIIQRVTWAQSHPQCDILRCGNKAGHSPCPRRLYVSTPCPSGCQHFTCSLHSPPTEPQVLGAGRKKDSTGRLVLKNSQGSEVGHKCLCQKLGAGDPECLSWEKGRDKGGARSPTLGY